MFKTSAAVAGAHGVRGIQGGRSAVRPPRKDGTRGRKVEAGCGSKLSATVSSTVDTAVRMKEA
jgi:hypothetical protein